MSELPLTRGRAGLLVSERPFLRCQLTLTAREEPGGCETLLLNATVEEGGAAAVLNSQNFQWGSSTSSAAPHFSTGVPSAAWGGFCGVTVGLLQAGLNICTHT